MLHEHSVQLRWSDPDSLGHVNHARALSLIEDARLAMLADVPGGPPDLILARLEVDYLRQLYYRVGERVVVRSSVSKLGRSSVTIGQELVQDGRAAIRAVAVCVHFDFGTDTATAMTDADRAHWGLFVQD